jgi:hypothetical protein
MMPPMTPEDMMLAIISAGFVAFIGQSAVVYYILKESLRNTEIIRDAINKLSSDIRLLLDRLPERRF